MGARLSDRDRHLTVKKESDGLHGTWSARSKWVHHAAAVGGRQPLTRDAGGSFGTSAPWLRSVTRRRLTKGAAAGAGWLSAALPGAAEAAQPTRTATKITLVWAPWASVSYSSTLVSLFQEAVKPFLAQNPGLNVVFSPA